MRRKHLAAGALGAGLAVLLSLSPTAVADTAPAPGEPATVTADPQPTWQTDGVVLAMEIVNGVAYVGGNFDHVRPPGVPRGGAGEVARTGLAAFDAATGELLPWAPVVTGPVFTDTDDQIECDNVGPDQWRCDTVWEIKAAPDGSKLYVAGDFAKVNGERRYRIAAFDTATGALDDAFAPSPNSRVRALAVSDTTVFAGGHFTAVGDATRTRLAAFNRADGALLPWAPTADKRVMAMVLAPSGTRVIVGGDFNRINGVWQHGLSAVNVSNGSKGTFLSNDIPYNNSNNRSWVTDLVTDGTRVYASADGVGTFDGRLAVNPENGARIWINNCLGATQAISVMDGVLYSGSHAHRCDMQNYYEGKGFPEVRPHRRFLAEPAGTPAGARQQILHWFPNAQPGTVYPFVQGPWTMANDGVNLWTGGDFTQVNDKPQEGLTRFTTHAVSPDVNGPVQTDFKAPTAVANGGGAVTVTWKATWDLDNRKVRYEVVRSDGAVACTAEANTVFWNLPTLSCTDTGLTAGSVYKYRIRAIDPYNNRISSPSSPDITVS
ncbi:hypothetical protein GCM10010156_47280 [Planobispora rosea]|uniref:Fibronectin type-III domain-containing protein n=1 Tax=Planobispora rosea TaxID=35762 RepID=A0A8J3RYK1_PLARO|nr:hypothetical protein [Planobispora rosea]GGS83148.1 hypothetical protein GCM10010156_47280 [Planobispora rosea]GIH84157.1 hypothetical protein Pro02_25650 [Planobispora rosea]